MSMTKRRRQPCATCGKMVMHIDGRPAGSHLRSAFHRSTKRAATLVVERNDGGILCEPRKPRGA